MQRVERRWTKKKEIRYLFPFDKAELLLFWLVSRFLGLVIVRFQEQIQLENHQFYLLYEVTTNFKGTA